MNTKRMRLVAAVLSAIALSAPMARAQAPGLIFTNLEGSLQVVQGVPCRGVVDLTTAIQSGQMTIIPSKVQTDGNVRLTLTGLQLLYRPFSVRHDCNGIRAEVAFREIGAQLASSVKFTGESIGNDQYRFSIPKEQFLIFESVVDNQPVQQPQTAYKRPSQDVTGVIDLRQRTTRLNVVLESRLRFRAGCVDGRCIIDEERVGTLTTDVSGRQ
jgi:hypothetical protein